MKRNSIITVQKLWKQKKLINTFELMNPIKLFENRIQKIKPTNEIERR